jgi:nucleotidyltransferase/DNA polymerase involved in DNA repair
MSSESITLHSWPRAILHLDADAFFASCEQAIHPELKGKPVMTGKERGIVAAASYEAKARGVTRG